MSSAKEDVSWQQSSIWQLISMQNPKLRLILEKHDAQREFVAMFDGLSPEVFGHRERVASSACAINHLEVGEEKMAKDAEWRKFRGSDENKSCVLVLTGEVAARVLLPDTTSLCWNEHVDKMWRTSDYWDFYPKSYKPGALICDFRRVVGNDPSHSLRIVGIASEGVMKGTAITLPRRRLLDFFDAKPGVKAQLVGELAIGPFTPIKVARRSSLRSLRTHVIEDDATFVQNF